MPCQVFFFDPWENDFLDKNQEQFFLRLLGFLCHFQTFSRRLPLQRKETRHYKQYSSAIYRHLGPGGAGGARAPPRIEILLSKIFQNGQNFIFYIIRAPPT